jgi:ribonuclease Z
MQQVTTCSLQLNGGSLTLIGRSRANDGTSFVIKELNWMLDCGALVQPSSCPEHIFLTHTHADHISCLAQAAFSSASKSTTTNSKRRPFTPCQIYLPAKAVPFVQQYLASYQAMVECGGDGDGDDDNDTNNDTNIQTIPYKLVPCHPGDVLVIQKGKSRYLVEIVKCHHRVECIGFSIMEEYSKLLPSLAALPKHELSLKIQTHKKQHNGDMTKLQMVIRKPLLLFLGDTSSQVFAPTVDSSNVQQQHQIVIVECTYLDDEPGARATTTTTQELAAKYKHMHWNDLKPIVQASADADAADTKLPSSKTLFVLIHFSLRYSCLYIREFFAPFPNVHAMLIEEEVESQWRKRQAKVNDDNDMQNDNLIMPPPPTCKCFHCQPVPQKEHAP